MGIIYQVVGLSAQVATQAAQSAEDTERLFGLDYQTLFDTAFTWVCVLILFIFLTNVLLKPMRAFLEKRRQLLDEERSRTQSDLEAVEKLKEEYEEKLDAARKDADAILSESRKASLKQEQAVLDEAKGKAAQILDKARQEARADKEASQPAVRDEVRTVASIMASQLVPHKIDTTVDDALLNEAMKAGDGTC